MVTADFAQTNTCGSQLLHGDSCSFSVAFAPTAAGARAGALSITDDVTGGPHMVALTGGCTDFAIEPAPGGSASQTVESGEPARYDLQVSALGGFSDSVALSCAGAPAGASCLVSPAVATATGAAAPFTVTVIAATGAAMARLVVLGIALGALAWLMRSAGRRRRWVRQLAAVAGLALVLTTGPSCGKSSDRPGLPPGNYRLAITGTGGGVSHTLPLELTVQ